MSANSLTMSESTSESREVHWTSLLSSPKLAKEAMRATIDATGWEAEPECGVPRVTMPATLLISNVAFFDVFSDSRRAYESQQLTSR